MCASALFRVWYPNDKGNEVLQIYLKSLGSIPNYVKPVGDSPYSIATKEGMKSYTIFEFPDEKTVEALHEIIKYARRYTSIVGYRWSLQIVSGVTESYKIAGIKPPTR